MSHYRADDRSCRAVIRVAEIFLKTFEHKLRCVVIGRSRVTRVHGLPQLGGGRILRDSALKLGQMQEPLASLSLTLGEGPNGYSRAHYY